MELVEQAQAASGAYLNLRSVVLQAPSPVLNPGPSACLAGWLDIPPLPSDAPLMVITLAMHWACPSVCDQCAFTGACLCHGMQSCKAHCHQMLLLPSCIACMLHSCMRECSAWTS